MREQHGDKACLCQGWGPAKSTWVTGTNFSTGVIAMEESYRGYRITAQQSYGVWRLWVNPIHPHLPILQHPQFVCDGPIDEALRDARSRVDALLARQS